MDARRNWRSRSFPKGRRSKVMSEKHRTELFRTFSEWALENKLWSPKTRETYYLRARAAELWLAENRDVSLCWAKPKDLKAYLFQSQPSPDARNQIRNALVGFGEFLVEHGYAEMNTALVLPRWPLQAGSPKALDRETVKKILTVARTFGCVNEAMVAVFLLTAIRLEELRTLEWCTFDPNIGAPEVWMRFTGKENKPRSIRIHETAQHALLRWRQYNPNDHWVFPSPYHEERAVSHVTVNKWIRLIGEEVGIRLYPRPCVKPAINSTSPNHPQ